MSSTGEERLLEVVENVLAEEYPQSVVASLLDRFRNEYATRHVRPLHYSQVSSSVDACRTCPEAQSTPYYGKWNTVDPDIVFILDNIQSDYKYFGEILPMLKAAGISSSFFGLLAVTKCQFNKVSDDNRGNCSHYLYDQIAAARPRAIIISSASSFDLFVTNQKNYTQSVGTSWWWGMYKVFCIPPLARLEESNRESYFNVISDVANFVYGLNPDILALDDST